MTEEGGLQHRLWYCGTPQRMRRRWIQQVQEDFPGIWEILVPMTLEHATNFLLGQGETVCGPEGWKSFQKSVIQWVWNMTGDWEGETDRKIN